MPDPCRCCRKRPLGVYGQLCDPCRKKLTAPAAQRVKALIRWAQTDRRLHRQKTVQGMYRGDPDKERAAWDRQRCAWTSKTPRGGGYQATFDVDDVRGFRPEAARATSEPGEP